MPSRREEILEISKQILARKGYSSTSMRDIAEACGLLAGSLYSHFRSKTQMVEFVLLPFLDELIPQQEAVLSDAVSGIEQLDEMLHRVVDVVAKHDAELTILHYDWSHIVANVELAEVVTKAEHVLDMWRQVILTGIGDGTIRSSTDPDITVRIITSAIHAVIDRKYYDAQQRNLPQFSAPALSDALSVLFVSGLRSSPSKGGQKHRSRMPQAGPR